MKSIRDLVKHMPETRSGLEEAVREYDSDIAEAVKRNPNYERQLREVTERTFNKYKEYLGGLTQKLSAAGHAVGYTADAWLATGDIVGSLGGNFLDLLAQIPEKAYSLVYAARTGNYLDSFQNIFEGLLSYLPGFTVMDQGLSRIIQKRMVKYASKEMRKIIGAEDRSSYDSSPQNIKDTEYTDVQSRRDNIIRVDFRKEADKRKKIAA